jgi:hypothetical protein
MRRFILAGAAALTVLAAATFVPNRAAAMTLPAAGGLQGLAANGLVQEAAYICRRVWRCGPYGCGWRRSCYWSGPRYYRPYGYRSYRYGYRPYRYYRRHYW